MTDHLLPPNATSAERAMALTTARVSDVPLPVAGLWNPDTCPAAVLPWLAWAFSVDIWDADWSEEQKRAAIAESIAVHRRKGTLWASRQALSGSIEQAELLEWHQYGGDPYCYRIETTGGLVDGWTYQNKLLPALKAAKNARSHLERITVNRDLSINRDIKVLVARREQRITIGVRLALDGSIRPRAAVAVLSVRVLTIGVRI